MFTNSKFSNLSMAELKSRVAVSVIDSPEEMINLVRSLCDLEPNIEGPEFNYTGLETEDRYLLICLLLILHKKGLIQIENLSGMGAFDSSQYFRNLGKIEEVRNDLRLLTLVEHFYTNNSDLSDSDLCDAIFLIKQLDHESFQLNFIEVFTFLSRYILQVSCVWSEESFYPDEIFQLISSLLPDENSSHVYYPVTDSQYMVSEFTRGKDVSYSDQVSENTPGILYDFLSYGFEVDCNKLQQLSDVFDFTVSLPDFRKKVDLEEDGRSRLEETIFLENLVNNISSRGKSFHLCSPQSLSMRGYERSLRQNLIDSGFLEAVITLPSGLCHNAGISVTLLVLDKDKRSKGAVRVVDASDCYEQVLRNKRKLDVSKILELIEENSGKSRIVVNSEFSQQDFNFSVGRYLMPEIQVEEGYELLELGKLITALRPNYTEELISGKLIGPRDLADNPQEGIKDFSEMEKSEIRRRSIIINESALILCRRLVGKSLKATYIPFSNEPVYLSFNLNAFSIDSCLVDKEFLIEELYSSYVLVQLDHYCSGLQNQFISTEDLLKVKIKIPSLLEQQAIVRARKEALVALKEQEARNLAKLHGVKSKAFHDFSSLKHSLGAPLASLESMIENIEIAIGRLSDSGEQVSLESRLSKRRQTTVGEGLKMLQKNVEFIAELLDKNEHGLDTRNYSLKSLDFFSFIRQYCQSCKAHFSKQFNSEITFSDDIASVYQNKLMVCANTEILKILLDNIVGNARRHAFHDREPNDCKLRFSISIHPEDDKLILEVGNNGKPFPVNFDKTKFIRKNVKAGDTGNTGIGGYDIANIIDYLGGDFDLILNEDELPTIYYIELPLID